VKKDEIKEKEKKREDRVAKTASDIAQRSGNGRIYGANKEGPGFSESVCNETSVKKGEGLCVKTAPQGEEREEEEEPATWRGSKQSPYHLGWS